MKLSWYKIVGGCAGIIGLLVTLGDVYPSDFGTASGARMAVTGIQPLPKRPTIVPSNVLETLLEKKKRDPAVSAQELAKIGNRFIDQQGFNFSFTTCAVAEANHLEGTSFSEPRLMNYQFTDLAGQVTGFQILVKDQGAPCGCVVQIPVLKIGRRQMTIIANHSPVKLLRPKEFDLDQVELVDGSLTKTVRKWYNHFDQPPIGISQNGKRIYFGTGYDDLQLDGLAIEMGEDGTPRLVSIRESDVITDREPLENFPEDPRNSYLGFMRFNGKNVNYVVKFSYPCT